MCNNCPAPGMQLQQCLQEAGYCYVHCGFTENELHIEICDHGGTWGTSLKQMAPPELACCATRTWRGHGVQERDRDGPASSQPTTQHLPPFLNVVRACLFQEVNPCLRLWWALPSKWEARPLPSALLCAAVNQLLPYGTWLYWA